MKGTTFYQRMARLTAAVTIAGTLILSSGQALAAYTLLRPGSSGAEVTKLQQGLKSQGYYTYYKITGYYGSITKDAVVRFQKAEGLSVDGIAGSRTQSALYGDTQTSRGTQTTTYITLKYGMRGTSVIALQNELKKQGFFYANSTGYYGTITQNAVIAFQKAKGLSVDGIAGPQTQRALYGGTASVNRGSDSSKVREDLYWLARIIQAEAGGEPYKGKVAVGNVIMNRVKSSSFPNTIYNVIFEYYHGIPQFSPVQDGSIYNTPDSQSRQAAEEAYYGARPVGDALYFFNPVKAAGSWIVNNRQYLTTIGGHAFYR